MVEYTLAQAGRLTNLDETVVSSDSDEYLTTCLMINPNCICLKRPADISQPDSPDIEWLEHLVNMLSLNSEDIILILRVTSPFRSDFSVTKALKNFLSAGNEVHSLRAVAEVSKHPGKMWTIHSGLLQPLLPFTQNNIPWHSNQTHALPTVYEQTASFEITRVSTLEKYKSISGVTIMPFLTEGVETIDINTPLDFDYAEYLIAENN